MCASVEPRTCQKRNGKSVKVNKLLANRRPGKLSTVAGQVNMPPASYLEARAHESRPGHVRWRTCDERYIIFLDTVVIPMV